MVCTRPVRGLDIIPAVCHIYHWCVQLKDMDSIPSYCTSVPAVPQPLLCSQVAASVHCAWLGVSYMLHKCF
jgi:hypothetical protein